MSPVRTLFISLLVVSGTATNARAQFPGLGGSTRPISLVISGGLTVPIAEFADKHDGMGFHYDASLLLNIPGFPIALRPEFSLTQFKWQGFPPGGGTIDGTTQMIAGMANIEVPLGAGLYALAGGGILSVTRESNASSEDRSASKFMFDVGAGFRIPLGSMHGFIEARFGAASYDQQKVGFSKAQFIPVTFGLVF